MNGRVFRGGENEVACWVKQNSGHGLQMRLICRQLSSTSHLPEEQPAFSSAEDQDGLLTCQSKAGDALREGDSSFLVSLRSRVDMDNSLARLSREDMRLRHSKAVRWRGTFLEDGLLGLQWLKFVDENGGVFGDIRAECLRGHADRGDELLCEHGGRYVSPTTANTYIEFTSKELEEST